jgi:hypothetical protein
MLSAWHGYLVNGILEALFDPPRSARCQWVLATLDRTEKNYQDRLDEGRPHECRAAVHGILGHCSPSCSGLLSCTMPQLTPSQLTSIATYGDRPGLQHRRPRTAPGTEQHFLYNRLVKSVHMKSPALLYGTITRLNLIVIRLYQYLALGQIKKPPASTQTRLGAQGRNRSPDDPLYTGNFGRHREGLICRPI